MDSSILGWHMMRQSLFLRRDFDDALYLAMFTLNIAFLLDISSACIVETLLVALEGMFLPKCTVTQLGRKVRH
jgi:hypothetical protein